VTDTQARQALFLPKFWTCLQSYSLRLFWGDLTSGIIVGIVALPLAIAFAIASGIHAQPLIAMEQSGLLEEFGEENVVSGIDPALTRARQLLRSP
jgi:MFS superfamily sulfate permease-like transporter